MLSLLDPNFKLLFFGGSRSSSPLALVLEVEGPEGLLKKEDIFDIWNENDSSKTTRNKHNNTRMRMCGTEPRCNTSGPWLTKKVPFSAQRPSAVLFVSHVVCTFLLAFERLSPNVSETWMILTRKRLLGDIFVTRRLSKSFAF